MNSKTAALLIGLVFILVGILGHFDNPIIGPSHDAIFHTDGVHNIVHLVSGALFLFVALAMPASAPVFLKIFGIVYLLLGVLGLFTIGSEGTTKLLGFLHVNGADNWLHIALGLIIFLAGMIKPRRTALNM